MSIDFPTSNRRTKEERVVGVTTYAWDPQDRLVAVYKPSQRTFTFVYNAAGQRITRQTYAGERKFVYDRNKPLLDTDAGAQTTLTYDYSNRDDYGELLSRRHQGVTDFHQYDALVSTKHLLDEAQSPTDGYIYRAFGKVESKTGATENHQLYVGRYGYFAEEELGLYFLNARYYDLETGQFISRDPIGYMGTRNLNLYEYAARSPINHVDPSGLRVDPWAGSIFCKVKVEVEDFDQIVDLSLVGICPPAANDPAIVDYVKGLFRWSNWRETEITPCYHERCFCDFDPSLEILCNLINTRVSREEIEKHLVHWLIGPMGRFLVGPPGPRRQGPCRIIAKVRYVAKEYECTGLCREPEEVPSIEEQLGIE